MAEILYQCRRRECSKLTCDIDPTEREGVFVLKCRLCGWSGLFISDKVKLDKPTDS